MLEYNPIDMNSDSVAQSKDENNVTASSKHFGFDNDAQEKLWMEQVRKECVHGISNRI